tara:strand:+ start:26439 stop:26978 length:540 start_codon:yes stop_codon:yes gene_type:complete
MGSVLNMKGNAIYSRAFGNHYFLIAVSLCLIFILMGLLSARLEREFEQAEQVQFDYRVAELKAAVRLMEADLISRGELQAAGNYEGANPMDWLEDDTSHYVGMMEPIDAINYPGNWFFDDQIQAISFVPYALNDSGKVESKDESLDKVLRFKVRALRSKELNSKYSGLMLEQLDKQPIR